MPSSVANPTAALPAWRQVVHTSGARIYWTASGIAITLLTARILGPDARGLFVAATTWVSVFAALGNLSLPNVLTYVVAGRDAAGWLPGVTGTTLVFVAWLTAAGWLLASVLSAATGVFGPLPPVYLAAAFVGLPAALATDAGTSILIALGRLSRVNATLVIGATMSAVLAVGLAISGGMTVLAVLIVVVVAQSTAALLIWREILGGAARRVFDRALARRLLTGSLNLHLHAVGFYLIGYSAVLILNYFGLTAEAAFYHLALQAVVAVELLATAASSVTYSMVAQSGPDAAWPAQRRLVVQTLAATAGLMALGAALGRPAIRLAAGDAFLPAVPILQVLLISAFGKAFAAVMVSQWVARGWFRRLASTTSALAIVSVAGNWIVIPRYGAFGAALVAVAVSTLWIITNGVVVWRLQRRPLAAGAP